MTWSYSLTTTGSGDVKTGFWSDYAGAGANSVDIAGTTYSDIGTASGIEVGTSLGTVSGYLTLTIVAVPEPSSALLSMAGLVAFDLRRRR